MFRILMILALLVTPGMAQTAPEVLGQALPAPDVEDDAPPRAFLAAAKQALGAARFDVAMEALERAESRALIRSVRPSLAGVPSDQKIVKDIQAARHALDAGDRAGSLAAIEAALADPDQ